MNYIYKSGGKIDPRNQHLINEDLIISNNNYVILMDGATGLSNTQLDEYLTSSEWYTKCLSNILQEMLSLNNSNNLSLTSIVKKAIKKIKLEIIKKEKLMGISLKPYEIPSASIIICRKRENYIDIFSLGDCLILIKEKNQREISVINDHRHNFLDNLVINRIKELAKKKNISIKEARNEEEIKNMLILNRKKINRPNGYYAASIKPSATKYAYSKTYLADDLEKIFICSDGFDINTLNLSLEEFMNIITNKNLEYYYNQIKKALISDKNWNIYSNRFKDLDDASATVFYCKEKI